MVAGLSLLIPFMLIFGVLAFFEYAWMWLNGYYYDEGWGVYRQR